MERKPILRGPIATRIRELLRRIRERIGIRRETIAKPLEVERE